MKIIHLAATLLIFAAAVLQLYGIGERVIHAYHQWQHFVGYSNNGHTTLNQNFVAFTYIVSVLLIFMGFYIFRSSKVSYIKYISIGGSSSLLLGLLCLSTLLISPYGVLR